MRTLEPDTPTFLPLSRAELELAVEVAAHQGPLVAFYFFRCLQRAAALAEWRGPDAGFLVRWRAEWLRGACASRLAIRGTSAHSSLLRELLLAHVFEPFEVHPRGHGTLIYRLKRSIQRGDLGERELAEALGLRLMAGGLVRPL